MKAVVVGSLNYSGFSTRNCKFPPYKGSSAILYHQFMVHTDVRYSIVQHKHTNNLATSISPRLKFIYYITLNFYESKWKLAVSMWFLETELHRISTLIIIVDVCLLICIYIYAIIFAYILHTPYHNEPYHRRPWVWIYYFGIINYGSMKNWAAVCL